jgi:hypothetical protein
MKVHKHLFNTKVYGKQNFYALFVKIIKLKMEQFVMNAKKI